MKSRLFRRAAAGLAACVLTVSAMAPLHFSVSAAENLITNSTFENGSADWGIYKESGGSARMLAQDGQLALHISSTGKVSYAVQMYYDIIPLYQNGVYHLEYDISSSVDRFVEGMIQQNGGTYQAYTWKGLDLTSTPQHVSYDFTMEAESDIMAKMVFNCGLQEKDGGDLGEHVIYLDNVVLELIDDTNVDYSSVRPYEPPIVASQVGYRPDDRKTAVVRSTGTAYDTLYVINYDTGSVAATVPLSEQTNYAAGNEDVKTADFSSVTTPGRYFLSVDPPERDYQDTDPSYSFEIREDAFTALTDETVKMLYMQRCGTAVEGGAHSHPACHTGMATVYGTNEKIDVSGGWHDAGDYGRYVVPGAKTIADILYAYLDAPETFSDSTGIPESGNGIPDIVDEAAYELDWMFKMQADNGGVYHKVTCENFPGYVAPQLETEPLIVTPISTTATADFAGAMALAAEVFKPFNPDYANKCLTAAEKAYAFLEQNPDLIFTNPADITTGEYGDKSDGDERYWAAAQLFRATDNDKYYEDLTSRSASSGMDWSLMGDYGNIALLTMKNADTTDGYYISAKSVILSQAKTMLSASKNSPYGAAVRKFNWGSNMTIANAGVILDLAYRLTGEQEYLDAANAQRDYLLGMNPLGECFVTGFGTVSPQAPHHRPSMAAGQAMPGMLVGGVNSALEDSAAKAYLKGVAPAKCYVDNSESYSTNEITIYWNSPLTYLLTLTENNEKETPDLILGDLNGDQKVNGFDTALLRQAIMNNEKPDAGDVNQDQAVDVSDLVMHQQWVLGKIQHFGSMITPPAPKDPDTPDNPATGNTTPSGITDFGTAPDSTADKFADFRQGTSPLFIASNGWTNGNPFDCGWYADKAVVNNGCLSLTIDKDNTGKYHYAAAEYRTNDFYGYGYYETSMQAIKNPGVVSSFFTYTGPSDNNPWDEIDIEVLGKDTTKVQFNYFTNSKGDHEYLYDLGFDASEGYHTYGFDWQPNSITWYVDGKAVHTATENIPSTPGKIMMNVWPGTGVDSWLAPFDGTTPLTARYQWVTYKNK